MARNHARTVNSIARPSNLAQARLWSRREAHEYALADVVTTASLADKHEMGPRAVWLPTPVTKANNVLKRSRGPSREALSVYGMLANFDYPPNRDAYDRLIRHWLPLLPSSDRVVVAGFGSEKLPSAERTTVMGAVGDVAEFYEKVDIVLAPIYLGGGMKVKVVEAMMYGKPVIASEHARSGLPPAIAEACVKWEQLPPDFSVRFFDPRNDSRVVEDLSKFTFACFRSTLKSLWQERMSAR
ncbi:glycosyltransferase family 4 protein [Mycobacterium sp. SM3041]|uniref:glycosyltransferase family 4 protein n=1 Tax=Mycobacterium sp. SM3041 TaxID=3114291 RepID=UPI00320484AB